MVLGLGLGFVAAHATFIATSAASSSSFETPGTKHSAMTNTMSPQ